MRNNYKLIAAVFLIAGLLIFLLLFACKPDPSEYEFAGTTNFDTLDISGTFNYGTNNLYPVGYASSGQQLVYGTDTITGTATPAHGLTTVTFCLCSLGSDPDDDAGDAAMCTTAVSSNVCTLKTWQDDFVTAATEADIPVHWLVVGTT
jgi:hypothetical protein